MWVFITSFAMVKVTPYIIAAIKRAIKASDL
jgi:hypothetical protein